VKYDVGTCTICGKKDVLINWVNVCYECDNGIEKTLTEEI